MLLQMRQARMREWDELVVPYLFALLRPGGVQATPTPSAEDAAAAVEALEQKVLSGADGVLDAWAQGGDEYNGGVVKLGYHAALNAARTVENNARLPQPPPAAYSFGFGLLLATLALVSAAWSPLPAVVISLH